MTQSLQRQPVNWHAIFSLTIFSAYFHTVMEWLFFTTKPSSLAILPPIEKLLVLIVSGGVFALTLAAVFLILAVPAGWIHNPTWRTRFATLQILPSALMLSVTALILLDNFTYTLFQFGIVTTHGGWRIIYTLVFLLTIRWMFRFARGILPTLHRSASFLSLSLLALSLTGILTLAFSRSPSSPGSAPGASTASTSQPNIIIIGADGLNANYLSVYGYTKETTPFLNELAKTSLIAGNAFTNASSTTASTTSALTGKEPAAADVYRYPDVLTGEDSFEHLPGILKQHGYRTVQIGVPYYVDAEQLNLLDGFDYANNRSVKQPLLDALRAGLGNSSSVYFIQTTAARAAERLLHIFFLQAMKNPFAEVNNPKVRLTDAQRVDQIIGLLEESDRPLFVFAHFMGTHGPNFDSEGTPASPDSDDEGQTWDTRRYEKAIQGFDGHVQSLFSYLEQSGKLDNSILVIYTDHGYRYAVNQRIPIIIHFPKDEHAGARKNNIQVIDIPVTLLDYLSLPQPVWMTGISMLGDEPPAERKIVSVTAGSPKKIDPPFYQIKILQVVICQNWYALNVQEDSWKTGVVRDHTSPCAADALPTDAEIRQFMLNYLESYGFDISRIQ